MDPTPSPRITNWKNSLMVVSLLFGRSDAPSKRSAGLPADRANAQRLEVALHPIRQRDGLVGDQLLFAVLVTHEVVRRVGRALEACGPLRGRGPRRRHCA